VTRNVEEELLLLRTQLDELFATLADRDTMHFRPVEWDSLDRADARDEWDRLVGFVDWLIDRYGVAETVPGCWYRHPAILEELSALHAAWLGAYLDPHAPADSGVAWHDSLERVLQRLREWDRTGCAGGTHRDHVPLPAAAGQLADRAGFIDADVTARPEPPDDDAAGSDTATDPHGDDDQPTLRLL